MKIGYFGDGVWAQNTLQKLLDDTTLEVAFVCSRYHSPDELLHSMAKEKGVDVLSCANINSKEFLEQIEPYGCELFVSMSFDQIFRKDIISMPRFSTINCHAGKLPFYRGRNILNWLLINDEKELGITVHYVDEGIDTGDILLQKTYEVTDDDNYGTLLEKAHVECAVLMYEAVQQIQAGTAQRRKQEDIHPVGFYCMARKQGDERIDWNQTSRDIFNFVRAVTTPGPCARSQYGPFEIKIKKVVLVPDAPVYKGIPGAIVGKSEDGFYVKTADTVVFVSDFECERNVQISRRLT